MKRNGVHGVRQQYGGVYLVQIDSVHVMGDLLLWLSWFPGSPRPHGIDARQLVDSETGLHVDEGFKESDNRG